MRDMTIKAKLAGGFGVPLAIIAAKGLIGYFSVQKLSEISGEGE